MACRGSADECRGDGFCGSDTIRTSPNIVCSAACNDGRAVASPLCCKCKERPAEAKANQTEDLCGGCLRSSLFAKFKLAVTSHSMINPSDNVLVAFSGGSASRLVLEFVHEMQSKAQKNLEASKDRSLPVFRVGVAFVVESNISVSSPDSSKAVEEVRLIVSNLAPPVKTVHVLSIGSVCSENFDELDGRSRLSELLHFVGDATGKEDFLQYLRMLALQKIAMENGYTKLVLGLCTSKLACHVISATVKGQGYSLPADVQYVDARWGIPVVLPLRDCVSHEITMLCQIEGLTTLKLTQEPHFNINSLVSSFVAKLQEENPSRERTILRTAEKLRPFFFNKLPESEDSERLSFRRRHALQKFKSSGSIASDFLCPICGCPVSEADLQTVRSNLETGLVKGAFFRSICCSSCTFQILPEEESSMDTVYSLLPEEMIRRTKCNGTAGQSWLRKQIEDCLLLQDSDEEHE
ncbi:cytoplasmic tRNA 2-thiolation protein 2 [Nymphaea colorata]|nr:cytoplasmic tRNA 2-thiolation protein 2 [Nymphaea colorata]